MVFLLVVKLPIDLMPSNVYDVAIRQGKAKDKPYKIGNGGGLYLLINATGKYWQRTLDGETKIPCLCGSLETRT